MHVLMQYIYVYVLCYCHNQQPLFQDLPGSKLGLKSLMCLKVYFSFIQGNIWKNQEVGLKTLFSTAFPFN